MPRRILASFWSVEPFGAKSRYHLGQVYCIRYIERLLSESEAGSLQHWAIVCDSDVLSAGELQHVPEIATVIGSLSRQPVLTRSMTTIRSQYSVHRDVAISKTCALFDTVRNELSQWMLEKNVPQETRLVYGEEWRADRLTDEQFVEKLGSQDQFPVGDASNISSTEKAGLLYLLGMRPPKWYSSYWLACMLNALDVVSKSEMPVTIVEGRRNRYVWQAMSGIAKMLRHNVEHGTWENVDLHLVPNLPSDGKNGYMCLNEIEHALLLFEEEDVTRRKIQQMTNDTQRRIYKMLTNSQEPCNGEMLYRAIDGFVRRARNFWIEGSDITGAARATAMVPAATAPVVLSVHGINTHGSWQKQCTILLGHAGIIHNPVDLGWLLPTAALSQSSVRKGVQKLLREYDRARHDGDRRHCIIAHSYGCIVVAAALAENIVEFDKVILLAPALPAEYDWRPILDNGQVKCLVNIKTKDWVIGLAGIAGRIFRSCGDAGRRGFVFQDKRLVEVTTPWRLHSGMFTDANFQRLVVPLICIEPDEVEPYLQDMVPAYVQGKKRPTEGA